MQIQLKSLDFNKNMISPDVPCGYFALGTLPETCLKDIVFNFLMLDKKQLDNKIAESKNVNFDMKIKNAS